MTDNAFFTIAPPPLLKAFNLTTPKAPCINAFRPNCATLFGHYSRNDNKTLSSPCIQVFLCREHLSSTSMRRPRSERRHLRRTVFMARQSKKAVVPALRSVPRKASDKNSRASRAGDLQSWLKKVDALGELRNVAGGDWDKEIGALSSINYRRPENPALLFDRIKQYPPGYRLLTSSMGSTRRLALAFRFSTDLDRRGCAGRRRPLLERALRGLRRRPSWARRRRGVGLLRRRAGPAEPVTGVAGSTTGRCRR